MILVLLEHKLIVVSGGTEKKQEQKILLNQAEVFPILYIFTIILQLKSLDPEILQKDEVVITECMFSKEAILGFLKAKKKNPLRFPWIRNVMLYFE